MHVYISIALRRTSHFLVNLSFSSSNGYSRLSFVTNSLTRHSSSDSALVRVGIFRVIVVNILVHCLLNDGL